MTDPLIAARNLAAQGVAARRGGAQSGWSGSRGDGRRLREQVDMFQEEWRIERELAAAGARAQPIIAGPWLSEVGFEVLYWIPFLRWFEDRYRVDRERVIAVSRGGVAGWYGDVADRYVEIFDHVDPATFTPAQCGAARAGESGGQKQTRSGAFDRRGSHDGRQRRLGLDKPAVCHPSLMYRLFNQFWFGNRALDLVILAYSLTCPLTMARPGRDASALPERYIAAKFYTGAALPDTAGASRRALRDLVRQHVRRAAGGHARHRHGDRRARGLSFRDIPNVFSLRGQHGAAARTSACRPPSSPERQAFIGTCGSLAWLAPMLGVDTVAVYADERFLLSHIFFATQVYRQAGAARFDTLDLRAAMQLDLVTGEEVSARATRPVA